ncbi:hypothetical protein ACD589_15630 [Rhizobium sp. 814_E9_N1_1]|uniref:hypothetical protein n=1 Tax=unclassified Rhizobium TaxID=2613769 RepID=UPI003F23A6AE
MRIFILSSLLTALFINPTMASSDADDIRKRDALALGFIAYKCNIPLRLERNVWLQGVMVGSDRAYQKAAIAFGESNLEANSVRFGKKEACRRFRGMLGEMNWL